MIIIFKKIKLKNIQIEEKDSKCNVQNKKEKLEIKFNKKKHTFLMLE